MSNREVTERDFRMPEFMNAEVSDYEFRDDGKIVRKDRWITAVNSVRYLVGISAREFEIEEVVDAVRELVRERQDWFSVPSDLFDLGSVRVFDLKMKDGSILCGAHLNLAEKKWTFMGMVISEGIVAIREAEKKVG